MTKKESRFVAIAFALLSMAFCACRANAQSGGQVEEKPDRDALYQVSALQALTLGDYYGSVSVGELKRRGDFGLGTFDGINGELIMLDGVVYRAVADGSVEVVPDDETVPFANASFFDVDEKQSVKDVPDFNALRAILDERIAALGRNRFYLIRLDGTFRRVKARSEVKQSPPYEPLARTMERAQTVFEFENIAGSAIGLYCPPYMNMLNAPGWHLHFISEDRTKGGHALELSVESGELTWDYTDGFFMRLPNEGPFVDFDLMVDQSEDIEKVETKAGER